MKNYILFSTTNSEAIDNVSMCIETEMSCREFSNLVVKLCKYRGFTVVQISKPLFCTVDTDSAIKRISELKLHRRVRTTSNKELTIITSSDKLREMYDVSITTSQEDGLVVLTINSVFEVGNANLLSIEHDMIDKLISLFGKEHLAYHKYRNVLRLIPSDIDERHGIDWALVKGDIVKIDKYYDYKDVEI